MFSRATKSQEHHAYVDGVQSRYSNTELLFCCSINLTLQLKGTMVVLKGMIETAFPVVRTVNIPRKLTLTAYSFCDNDKPETNTQI